MPAQHFDRESYIAANVKGPTQWHSQSLENVTITVVSDTALVHCAVYRRGDDERWP